MKGKRTVLNWGMYYAGAKQDLWIIAPEFMSLPRFMRIRILLK